MAKLTKLHPSIDLDAIREEWLAIGLATGPDDIELRDRSIDLAYRAAGLEPPKIRICLRSPLEGAIGAMMLARVKCGSAVRSAVDWAVDSAVRSAVYDRCYGSHDAGWLSFYWVFRRQLPDLVLPLEGLWGLARSTGWFWPFRGAVIFTARPTEIHRDGIQLHRDGGPALSYPDGFALWRLHGVEVPDWLAREPADSIDPRKLGEIRNTEARREFVRKLGIGRVLSGLDAKIIASSGLYELLELEINEGQRRIYLRMQNPSVDAVHIEAVPPECRDVQAALNFRNGLTPDMIDDVNGADTFQQGDVILRPRGATRFKSRPKILT